MKKIAFFDTKKYDIESFDRNNSKFEIIYYEDKLIMIDRCVAHTNEINCLVIEDELIDG